MIQPNPSRNTLIDTLRGIVILDMVLVHFDYVFPRLLAKVIDYSDFAMEGFIFLAGYSVAMRYWPVILERPGMAFRKLIAKTLKLYAVQVLMIFTISLPLYLLAFEHRRAQETIGAFTLKSLALVNQVGLIHILPTFIPLFVISPLLLFAFKRGLDSLVLAASVFLFALGNFHPYLLDLGEKTIFPFILWQIYFVAGCYLGIRKGGMAHRAVTGRRSLLWAVVLFAAMMIVKHSKALPPGFISKFPLNALGLLYGASILWLVAVAVRELNPLLSRLPIFKQVVLMLGRHSLLAFVLHVYTAILIGGVRTAFALSTPVVAVLMCFGMVLIILILYGLEKRCKKSESFILSTPSISAGSNAL